MNNNFTFEKELTQILGEDKVLWIKKCGLEDIFDSLYDYYFEYSPNWYGDIIRAYDAIYNGFVIWFRDELIKWLSNALYGRFKKENEQ